LIAGGEIDYRKSSVRDSDAWLQVRSPSVWSPVKNRPVHPRKSIAINATAGGQIKYSGYSAHLTSTVK